MKQKTYFLAHELLWFMLAAGQVEWHNRLLGTRIFWSPKGLFPRGHLRLSQSTAGPLDCRGMASALSFRQGLTWLLGSQWGGWAMHGETTDV